ncbi:MAG: hypothetical protein HN353_01625 [Bdellovibrionales bacterium]|jgi:hypothetical protein|nr:hypothetical protein [Bdellovibrionales bacterium]MBT3525420.1 hypothetical protein [Bdellovibrionales bacterium]MBT7766257.1 hypothetical protein [Bdellovibrionales bacterium]
MIQLQIDPQISESLSRSFLRRHQRLIEIKSFLSNDCSAAKWGRINLCLADRFSQFILAGGELHSDWYVVLGAEESAIDRSSLSSSSERIVWGEETNGFELEKLVEGLINLLEVNALTSLKTQAWKNRQELERVGRPFYQQVVKGEGDSNTLLPIEQLEDIIELFSQVTTINVLDQVMELLNQFQTCHHLGGEIIFFSPLELHHQSIELARTVTPYLLSSAAPGEEEHYLCWCSADDANDSQAAAPLLHWPLVKVVESFFFHINKTTSTDQCPADLSLVLGRLELPVVLISGQGELLLQNDPFLSLAIFPGECLELSDGAKVERNSVVYKVIHQKISTVDGAVHSFVFLTSDEPGLKYPNISSSELGIISSSIAHELNNPLAGMLAAITLLLDDQWDQGTKDSMLEMRASATRCKRLVEIFLGFSRSSPRNEVEQEMVNSFEQAMELLRFRMIESNCLFDIEKEILDKFDHQVNGSVTTMIFYLLFNQLITSMSHQQLVTPERGDEGSNGKGVEGVLTQKSDEVLIALFFSSQLQVMIERTKLINYLLELERLKLTIHCSQGGRVEFSLR